MIKSIITDFATPLDKLLTCAPGADDDMGFDFSDVGVDTVLSSNVGVVLDLIWSVILMGSAQADGTTTLGDWTIEWMN